MSVEVGQVVEGVVTGITNFGAFVKLSNGKTGLVHISEVADDYVKDIHDYVQENETVKVKVLSIQDGGEKIGLSMRKAGGNSSGRSRRDHRSFEKKLSKFLKESDRKISDLRRHNDSRRS